MHGKTGCVVGDLPSFSFALASNRDTGKRFNHVPGYCEFMLM